MSPSLCTTHLLSRIVIIVLVVLVTHPVAAESDNKYLDMDLVQLMSITISSVAKKEQRLADAAAAVFVITEEDIRRSGVTHIADALAMAPGLQVAKISSDKWSISSRGFTGGYTSSKLLVLIDGRSVYSPLFSGTFWDMQHLLLEDVERIEVIRGPGGTLWGANAFNGVINIITKHAEETQGGLIRTGVGDQETFQAAGRYGSKLGDGVYGRAYLSYNDRDSNVLADSANDSRDDWQSFSSGFRIDGSSSANDWTVHGQLFGDNEDQIQYPYWIPDPPYLTSAFNVTENRGGNVMGHYRQRLSSGDVLSFQAFFDYADRDDGYYQTSLSTLDAEAQYETAIGSRNNLIIGAGARFIDVNFTPSFQVHLPDSTFSLFNIFLQNEISLVDDRLMLTVGTKWEHTDYAGSEWQPNARLMWRPKPDQSLWAAVSRAVRTPSMVEREGNIVMAVSPTPEGTTIISFKGNDDYESETVVAYEAGHRWQAREDLSFDVAIFYNDYANLLDMRPVQDQNGYNLYFSNMLDGHGYGLEIAANWQAASWLSFAVSYSYLELDLTAKDSRIPTFLADITEKNSPTHQASLRSSIELAENWRLNLWLRYTDTIEALSFADLQSGPRTIDSHLLFDANLAWTPTKNLELTVVGQNLFSGGQLQYIHEFATMPTEIEQSIYAKLAYRF